MFIHAAHLLLIDGFIDVGSIQCDLANIKVQILHHDLLFQIGHCFGGIDLDRKGLVITNNEASNGFRNMGRVQV